MYCAGDHLTASCTVKQDSSRQKCVLCLNSDNNTLKLGSFGHNAGSTNCPVICNMIKSIQSRTQLGKK